MNTKEHSNLPIAELAVRIVESLKINDRNYAIASYEAIYDSIQKSLRRD